MTPQKPFFATPADVEAAFYEALEQGDLEGMMAVWADDEEIVCIHPGGPRLVGYATVREAWRRLFERGSRLQVRTARQGVTQNPFAAIHSVLEEVTVAGERLVGTAVVATNVYVRGALGWRMVVHHASAAPPEPDRDMPKVLH